MDVTMPQLGETVTEGTITRWLKQVGDHVDADEPLFEVSTDKVDSEVPAPSAAWSPRSWCPRARRSRSARAWPSSVTPRGRARARRGPCRRPRRSREPAPAAGARAGSRRRSPPPVPAPAAVPPHLRPSPRPAPESPRRRSPFSADARRPHPSPCRGAGAAESADAGGDSSLTSPIVRRLVAERGLDVSTIQGTGPGGRITRKDVLDAVPRGPRGSAPRQHRRARHRAGAAPPPLPPPALAAPAPAPAPPAAPRRRACARAGAAPAATAVGARRARRGRSRSTTSAGAPPSTWCSRWPPARTCTRRSRSTSSASNACAPRTRREWKAHRGLLAHLPAVHRRARSATPCTSSRRSTRASATTR